MELSEVLTKLKDVNALIEPNELVRLIEEVGMLIDDLDLDIIVAEHDVNTAWHGLEEAHTDWPKVKVTNQLKLSFAYQVFKEKTALLKRLRRHYRLLNTKLNLITKPKGR